jgi:hypothetical protein
VNFGDNYHLFGPNRVWNLSKSQGKVAKSCEFHCQNYLWSPAIGRQLLSPRAAPLLSSSETAKKPAKRVSQIVPIHGTNREMDFLHDFSHELQSNERRGTKKSRPEPEPTDYRIMWQVFRRSLWLSAHVWCAWMFLEWETNTKSPSTKAERTRDSRNPFRSRSRGVRGWKMVLFCIKNSSLARSAGWLIHHVRVVVDEKTSTKCSYRLVIQEATSEQA